MILACSNCHKVFERKGRTSKNEHNYCSLQCRYTMVRPRKTLMEIFMNKVRVVAESGCWECTASKHKFGYGWIRDGSRAELFHRAAWKLFRGPIPPNMQVLHKPHCHNPPCGNPDHLYLGTDKENRRDMVLNQTLPRGEQCSTAKLTEKEVREIKSFNKKISGATIAKVYGVSPSLVALIRSGQRWKHIT